MAKIRIYLLLSLLALALPASAQIITSSMSGLISDSKGEALQAVTVVATHLPTGTIYYSISNSEGIYSISGMRPGGPYSVEISCLGYTKVSHTDITLTLASNFSLDATMKEDLQSISAAILVSERARIFSSEKMGATEAFARSRFGISPMEDRSIADIIRLSAYAGEGISIAGSDPRAVNFTVDGANFNNNFGLGGKLSGGGNPISVEALAEVQVVVSPYDVRQTNFTGAGINAITQSGTNTLKGSAYYQPKLGANTIYGATLGGPIITNKLFFFGSFEYSDSAMSSAFLYTPSQDGISDSDKRISRTTVADMEAVKQHVMSTYGYDPGSFGAPNYRQTNIKALLRLDWNISNAHKLTFRANHSLFPEWNGTNGRSVDGAAVMSRDRISTGSMAFSNSFYIKYYSLATYSLDINSRLSDKLHNELLITTSHIDDERYSPSEPFPFIDILKPDTSGAPQAYMSLGYEPFSWNNCVSNHGATVKDDLIYYAGKHKLTAGLSIEYQRVIDAYMRNGTGYYRYESLSDFLEGAAPQTVCLTYGYDGKAEPSARVRSHKTGLYLQDEWSVSKHFKLNIGLRLDRSIFLKGDLITNNSIFRLDYSGAGQHLAPGEDCPPGDNALRIDTGRWPDNHFSFSPRLGFNWDIFGNESLTLRGGTGLFNGRLPLVMLLNMPTNSGMFQHQAILNGSGLYNASKIDMSIFKGGLIVDSQGKATPEALRDFITSHGFGPVSVTDGSIPSVIAAIDPKFKMPQSWKSSLSLDVKFPTSFPLTLSAEGIFSKTIYDVCMRDLSFKDISTLPRFSGADNRPNYSGESRHQIIGPTGESTNIPNAYMLTNTSKGYGYTLSLTVNATPVKGLKLRSSYTHTAAYELTGIPDDEVSAVIPIIPNYEGFNNNRLHLSDSVIPHRFINSVSYTSSWGGSYTLIYEPIKGRKHYSYMVANDLNGDGYQSDLIYIPSDPSELRFVSEDDRTRFWDFVCADSYLSSHKGSYAQAYSLFSPWHHKVSLRIAQTFKLQMGSNTYALQLSAEAHNPFCLLGLNWDAAPKIGANSGRIIKYERTDPDGQPVYSTPANISASTTVWTPSPSSSVLFGVKLLFN